jgi:hypothetical protein
MAGIICHGPGRRPPRVRATRTAELFGHADVQMAQRYAHIMPEVRLRTVHLLDDAAHERASVDMSTGHLLGLLDDGSSENVS